MEQRVHYLRELLRHYGTLSLPLASDLKSLLAQVLQGEDVGHLALILALRLLPELLDLDQDNTLAEMASELVVHWADLLIETTRATRESYDEDRRLTRLRLLARSVRQLKQRIVQAGVARLTAAFLDPGEHEQVRCRIIHCIGDLGAHAPLQALFACLRACPIPVSMAIERTLPMLANQVSLEPLITAVLDPNEHWQVREQAALLLGRSGKPEGIPALIQVAGEDASCANTAINALALLGKDAPLDVLLDILRSDDSPAGWKRFHAARALGELGQEQANEALIEVLSSAQDHVDAEIVEALVKLRATFPSAQLITWLTSDKWPLQWLAIESLLRRDEPVPTRPLLTIVHKRVKHDDYTQHRLRASALRLLNQQGALVPLPDLRRLLKENHWSLQDGLREAFAFHGATAPLRDLLQETLTSGSHEKALQAMRMLELVQQDVPVEALLAHYAHGITGIDSRQAEWGRALLQSGAHLPAELLVNMACECAGFREDNDDEDMVEALGKRGDFIADALLAKLPAYSVIDFGFLPRVAGAIYNALPEQQLLDALQKSEGDICTAAGILAVTGEDRYLPLLRTMLDQLSEQPVRYCNILSALARFRERFPLDILLAALLHEHAGIRETAVDILRELSTVLEVSQLVSPLQAAIRASQTDPAQENYGWSVSSLVEALGLCREHAPIAFLVALLEDEYLSDEAGGALAALGQYVPGEVFFAMLRSPNRFVNEHALLGLGKQKERVPIDQLLALFPFNSDAPEKSGNEHEEPDQEEDEDEQEMTSLIVNALLELEAYASADVLQGFLQHESERVRAGAQKALAELATKGLRERVIRPWLNCYDEQLVRLSVVEAHAAPGDAVDPAFWLEALEDDEDESLALGAACVLEHLARVIPATIATLAPACHLPGMRLARLRAWSMLGEVDQLLNAARSETNDQARWRAIEILGELRDPRALEPLIQLLRAEDDSRLLLAVIQALRAFGSAVPPDPLLETCGYRNYESRDWCRFAREPGIEAAAALKQAHPDVFRSLVPLAEAMLRGEPPAGVFASRPRSQIADAMKGIGRAGPLMVAYLSESLDWPHWQVRMKAAQALGKLRCNIPDATIRKLLELRHDPQSRAVREAADEALAEILSLETGIEDD